VSIFDLFDFAFAVDWLAGLGRGLRRILFGRPADAEEGLADAANIVAGVLAVLLLVLAAIAVGFALIN
jgi:hypothetical protein